MHVILIELAWFHTGLVAKSYLEESQEEIKLLLRRAPVETVAAGVEEGADQADTEEVIW